MATHLEFAIQIAKQAGQLLLQHFATQGLQTSLKSDRTMVTEADLAADWLIASAIQDHYPGEAILSEELQPAYQPNGNTKSLWVVDPLDGTTNFSLGLHLWGVLVTRLAGDSPETTAMFFPLIDECYTAQRGHGAYLNGKLLNIEPPDPDHPAPFFSCCSRTFRRYTVSVPYKTRILGSAAYSFCSVARGIAVLSFEATPKIWDIAGGWLLVKEAGGVIETLDGTEPFPLKPGTAYSRQSFPTLAAATALIASRAHQQIQLKQSK